MKPSIQKIGIADITFMLSCNEDNLHTDGFFMSFGIARIGHKIGVL